MAEASKHKLAWEAACLLTEKIQKRGPERDLDSLHDLDAPLDLSIQEDLEDRFTKVYSWNGFPSAMVGCRRPLHFSVFLEWVPVCNGRV